MKPVFVTLALAILSFSGFAQGEAEKPAVRLSKNYFYLSPFNLIAGQFQFGYERDFGKRSGLLFMPSVIATGPDYIYYAGFYDNSSTSGFGVAAELQYRYRFISLTNPRGKTKNSFRMDFYTAPFLAFQYLDYTYEESFYDQTSGQYYINGNIGSQQTKGYSGGLLFGARFTFLERLTLDAYAGGGLKISSREGNGNDMYNSILLPGHSGVIGKVNLQIGVAF